MFIAILLVFAGIPVGHIFRNNTHVHRWVRHMLTIVIWVLLFILGIKLGSDKALMNQIESLGLQGITIGCMSILGSLCVARVLGHYAFPDAFTPLKNMPQRAFKNKTTHTTNAINADNATGTTTISNSATKNNTTSESSFFQSIKSSLVVLCFFFIGVIIGVYDLIPTAWAKGSASMWVLYILLVLAGMGVGFDLKAFGIIRELRGKILLVPFGVILGSFLGSLISSFFFTNISALDSIAVGFGFGYYSLAPLMITEAASPQLGSVALMANMIHEVITLPLAPLMIKAFGHLAPIMSGGAASMDTCLPTIARNSGERYAIIAIFNGIVLTIAVPILVPFVLSLRNV